MKNWRNNLVHLFITFAVTAALCSLVTTATAQPTAPSELPGIHNFFKATDKVFSGSQPEGDAGFEALAKLGVKTILSVDGSKPDVEMAAKHGMRYIHLPYGYDGIPTNRVAELAKVATTVEGPIFVHCHHGKHRGPAAVGVMCEATGTWTTNQANQFLHSAGTSSDYPGLYHAVQRFSMPSAAVLAGISTNFPAVAKTSSFVDTMVTIDGMFDRLKAVQKAGWEAPKNHPDVSPQHEAVLLWEQFRELGRTEDVAQRTEDFRRKLHASERITEQLRDALREKSRDTVAADLAFKQIGESCLNCHERYRNE